MTYYAYGGIRGARRGGHDAMAPPFGPTATVLQKKCTENDIKKSHCLAVLQLKCQDDDDGGGGESINKKFC